MADQISYKDPIWELTPTELNVAYLSLTLTKKEISTALHMSIGTVGSHLGEVYEELGISGDDNDKKRARLKEDFGQIIERMVAEVNEDYQGEYKQRRKEALDRKSDTLQKREAVGAASAKPAMNIPPPAARPIPRPQAQPRRGWIPGIALVIIAVLAISVTCLFVFVRVIPLLGLFPPTTQPGQQSPSQIPVLGSGTASLVASATSVPDQTTTEPSTALPLTETLIPTISPTAVPLPIKEDFSKKYSNLWWVSGDPLVTDHVWSQYSGVLTTEKGSTAIMMIGNTAWTDYLVSLRAYTQGSNQSTIGVRVNDPNNMIILECIGYYCQWVIIYQGQRDVLPGWQTMIFDVNLDITVKGDTFAADATSSSWSDPR